MSSIVPMERIAQKISLIRGKKVIIDSDLAKLYGVKTQALNQAVKRNKARFPDDFMFQLNNSEHESLISQIVISKEGRGGRRKLPYVFTEQGVAMLSSVLKSTKAVQVNIMIMRTFVRIREVLSAHKSLIRRLKKWKKHMTSSLP